MFAGFFIVEQLAAIIYTTYKKAVTHMLDENRIQEMLLGAARNIKELYPDSSVMLFGSYARGDQTEDSDVDLCVLVTELTKRRFDMEVEASIIARKALKIPFDLLLYTYDELEENAMKKSRIQYQIKKDGVLING
jgi:predicted nucleotidyltransferase